MYLGLLVPHRWLKLWFFNVKVEFVGKQQSPLSFWGILLRPLHNPVSVDAFWWQEWSQFQGPSFHEENEWNEMDMEIIFVQISAEFWCPNSHVSIERTFGCWIQSSSSTCRELVGNAWQDAVLSGIHGLVARGCVTLLKFVVSCKLLWHQNSVRRRTV